MKFSCDKQLLQAAVATAGRCAATKSSITALEGILIETPNTSEIQISGYDLKTGIRTKISAEVFEGGSIVLSARLLGEIVRRLPDDYVEITSNENSEIYIECGKSHFNLIGIPSDEYPSLPSVDFQNSVYIQEKLLKSMISETLFAVSDNEARPIHTGSLFELDKENVTVVSVDGYRLALRCEKFENSELDPCSFVVPGSALAEVEKITADVEDTVKITLGTKHILFTIGDTELISRRLEGEFLNYEQALPQNFKYIIEADRKTLINSIERVSLIINDKLKSPIRCQFKDSVLSLTSETAIGRASDECIISGDAENLEIGFNNKYLLDALRAAPSDSIKIQLNTGISPCVIIPAQEDKNFLYMVLPVRLRSSEG